MNPAPARRLRPADFGSLLLPTLFLLYLSYHTLNGNRSLPARRHALVEREVLYARLDTLRERRAVLQAKIRDLGNNPRGTVDPDLLSEQLRGPGFIRKDEFLILERNH